MNTLELLEVFGKWFWDLATTEQVQEIWDHLDEVANYTAYREAQQEILYCESLANPV